MPSTTREVRLATTPRGLPVPGDLTLINTPLPPPTGTQLLVRNRHFLVFGGLRTLLGGAAQDTPVPVLRPGDTLFGPALGEVLHAPDGSPLRPGDLVTHPLGWREHALVPVDQCTPVDPGFPDPVAQLSSGATAYGALTRLTGVREGDTVLVTGAAGGVGSLAGQVARLLGAGRVIGTTGSAWKAERLVGELGYDAVVTGGSWRGDSGAGRGESGYDDVAVDGAARGNFRTGHGESGYENLTVDGAMQGNSRTKHGEFGYGTLAVDGAVGDSRTRHGDFGYDILAAEDAVRSNSRAAYEEFAAQLAEVAPDGVDVVVDTVGGAQLAGALGVARHGARFALVGALSGQLAEEGTGGSAPVEVDAFRIILKGVSLRGYLGADHPDVEAEWVGRFASWLRAGEIRFPVTRTSGIDQAPQALRNLIDGQQFGTAVVELASGLGG
ncbi:zinc-binding dehydrogenase [Streptomyces sp. ST1015]|uniref:zinc-binding dehydrogenase n=1 Tax=unclassified Streptomyces TaxID=2593676 RepID=UPI000DD85154|nr:zinc-binding dehydrogenase [Streptomyces sp. ST1015]QZZ32795.1 zinc-binding dehydrogenase [Streptomyces sp. ST1015]